MSDLPPPLLWFLSLFGVSPAQARWRWMRQREAFARGWERLNREHARHKFCRHCGHIAVAEDRRCPNCHHRLPSYWGSKFTRAVALDSIGGGVTGVFLAVLIAVYCLSLALTSFRGLLAPDGLTLQVFGAFSTALAAAEPWRILTMGLMHIGVIHLVFNLMALSQILGAFESEIGPWPTVVLLTLTQLGAIGAHALWYDPRVLTAGSSGMAFGLIGFGVAYFHRARNLAQRRFFLQWAGYGLLFGMLIGANNAAHLGGFLAGLPLGWLAAGMRLRHAPLWRGFGWVCLVAWILAAGCLARNVVRHQEALRPETTGRLSLPAPGFSRQGQGASLSPSPWRPGLPTPSFPETATGRPWFNRS